MSKRTAVSVLLTRDRNSTEVYLVERNPKLKFFGGYFAFPGGTLDESDSIAPLQGGDRFGEETRPFVTAAAREIFEETGLLLTRGAREVEASRAATYRKQLLADQISFAEILGNEGHAVDGSRLQFICKIVTPEFSPVRYETLFFWAEVPDNQTPDIWPGELLSGRFISAQDALLAWKRGDLLIVPPVVVMLQTLAQHTVATFTPRIAQIAQSYLNGELHRVYFTPGIEMLSLKTRTLPPATHTNCYLIGEAEVYIVDPAPSDPTEQEKLWRYLANVLDEGRTLKGILLTHHHSDHVGAVAKCQTKYDLPLLAHKHTADKLPHLVFENHLDHGDTLALGESPDGRPDWSLSVLHTPGHASGHIALRESRYGAVVAGDLISAVSTIVISPPDGHLASYIDSLKSLESITAGTLYPSHGPAVRDGKGVIRYYLKHRQEREQKLLVALSQSPQSVLDLVPQVYDDVDSALWSLAENSLRAGLIKLVEEGRCRELGHRYVLS